MTFSKYQSAFDIFHNTTAEIVTLGDYDDYENTYSDVEVVGETDGDLQPYSGGLAEKEYGLDIECQYVFYCHTNDLIKEGVLLRIDGEYYRVQYAAPWSAGCEALLKEAEINA